MNQLEHVGAIGYTNHSPTYRLGDVFNGLDAIDDPLLGNQIGDMKVTGRRSSARHALLPR
jgi:hypothetical protein